MQYDAPYLQGKADYMRGVAREMNPFDFDFYGSPSWEAWFEGWDDASEEWSESRKAHPENRQTTKDA